MRAPRWVRVPGGLWLALPLVGVLCGVLTACRDALQPCLTAYANGAYAEAVQLCEAAHATSGEPRAGATAARALAQLGAWDRALAWVERLRGTEAEPGLWSVAALVHLRRGEREQAAAAYRRDLALLAKTGDPAGLARAHYGLYFLAWEESRYREALEAARLSFAAAGKAADRRGQGLAAEALYTVLYALGDLDGAHRALDLAARLFPLDNAADRVRLLGNRGGLALDEGRPALARHDIQQAVDLARGSGDDRFFRSHQLNLVQASLALGDLDGAARHLAEAWRHAEPESLPETALLYYRARVSRARGDLAVADRALSEALAGDPVLDWVWELEDERGRVAQARGDLVAAEAAWRRSIAAVEQLRGAVGFDDLKAWLLDRKRDPFESLFLLQARSGRASEALGTVERATVRTFQDAFVEAVTVPATGGALWTAAADRVDELQELLPAMSESPAAALMPVEKALAASRGRRVLVYFEAQGELWRIDVVRGKARPRRLDVPAERLRDLVDRFRTDPEPGVAAALGALLLPGDLTPGELLHVVPDGALARLSFAALRRNGRRLVEDHAIAYVPGVSFLAGVPPRRGPGGGAVVLADPLGNLPEAAAEGRAVARVLATVPRLGSAATRAALVKAAEAEVLHVAGHAGWGPGGSWLELADGPVTPAALLAARVRPRLVVLASCASAYPAGRGLWGSPGAAFLAAGSGSVLATLGSVGDREARDLVRLFYQEGGAADPSGGLARAQRALLAAGRPPSTWAPFVVMGAPLP